MRILPVVVLGALLILLAGEAIAAEVDLWPTVRLEVFGDFIGGYFTDEALKKTAGRETQVFKMSRGLLGVKATHESGFGGLFEYNFLADEPKREVDNLINPDADDRHSPYADYYKNLGTELLYYGEFKARNAYAFWHYDGESIDTLLRIGRMVNIIGFEEEEVPFWGRLDSPHAHYITKEILNGVALAAGTSWLRLEGAVLSGRGRPDSDYNWYLNGDSDPNRKDNSTAIVEAEATLRWREYASLSAGYHRNKTGSAPGSLFSGKHNDNRLVAGARLQSGRLGPWLNRVVLLGQVSRFEDGLTEDGHQGENTPGLCNDLRKDGWFATAGLHLFDRLALYATYEEIDRIDALVWQQIANFDPDHPAFDSVERSTIVQLEYAINRWARLSGFYRFMDFDYPHLSLIDTDYRGNGYGLDKAGVTLRVQF